MSENYKTKKTQTLVLMGLYTALVTSVTLFTSIQYSAGGYFNLGDVVVLLLAAITPFRQALVAASLGSMIADVLASAVHYAVFTGIIKGLMVVAVVLLSKFLSTKAFFVPFLVASLVMLGGYALVDGFILGGYSAVASLVANLAQGVLGALISTLIYPFAKKLNTYLKG